MRRFILPGAVFAALFFVYWLFVLKPWAIDETGTLNEYHFVFGGISDRHIQIEAEIEMASDTLSVHPDEIWYLPEAESWWQWINIEDISDMEGSPLKASERQGQGIAIEGASGKRIRIRYSVDISYVDEELPYGTSAAGSAFEAGYFTVAKPFFVTGEQFPGAQITIAKPASLHFDAPWTVTESGYFASSYDALTQAAISFGEYEVISNSSGGLDYRLIAFGLDPEVKSTLSATMSAVSNYYLVNYPLPSASRYIQFVYPERYLDGEAYPASSVSGIVPEKIGEGGWKLTMAHELFHVWNPFLIPGAESEKMEWFKEGFTSYLSESALVETGEIEKTFLESHVKAEYNNYLENLQASPETITIGTSGKDKDEYGPLVYDGGRAIAAWLDRELVRASGGETDLKTLIVNLIEAAEAEKTNLDMEAFLSAVARVDPTVSGDLKIYLETKTPVPRVVSPEE